MYSKESTKELQQLSGQLLAKQASASISKKNLEDLRKVIRFHEHRYYILNDPLISDQEYD